MREELTEQQVADLKEWLIWQRDACDELHGNDCKDERCMSNRIALASLEAEKDSLGEIESGVRALKMPLTQCNRMNYCSGVLMNLDDVIAKAKERLYTAPPVPVLRLPGVSALIESSESLPSVRDVAIWDAAIAEVQRLNAGAQVVKQVDLSKCRTLWYDHDDLSAEVKCIPVRDLKKAIRAAGGEVAE